ncbi:MAG: Rieske (2Fe-2S) protein [Actinomycetota bacterium]|nr:Rieske (2Fe-2S) protein [Actinomycetota bacterium]
MVDTSRRRLMQIGGLSVFGAVVSSGIAVAVPSVPCTRAGQKVIADGFVFQCVRVKGRLRWQRRGAAPALGSPSAPEPEPSSTAIPTPPSEVAVVVAALSGLPDGRAAIVATVDAFGRPVEVVLIRNGSTVRAFDARCTHRGCIVAASDSNLVCRCHYSVFDGQSGARLAGPAPSGLVELATAIVGNDVFVSL